MWMLPAGLHATMVGRITAWGVQPDLPIRLLAATGLFTQPVRRVHTEVIHRVELADGDGPETRKFSVT